MESEGDDNDQYILPTHPPAHPITATESLDIATPPPILPPTPPPPMPPTQTPLIPEEPAELTHINFR
jgi:hypothetical protein